MYVADGYGNKRVAVIDGDTGKMLRFWGAYGNKPDDATAGRYNPAGPLVQQFRRPVHCAVVSNDRIVYVCDRVNDRVQSFTPEGKFIKEVQVSPNTLGDGSTWDIAFSKDPQQKYMYLADGHDEKVWIIDRQSMEMLTSFGSGGKQPGQFYAIHSIDNRLEGQHLHDGNLRRPASAALPLQGHENDPEGNGSGNGLAEDDATRY